MNIQDIALDLQDVVNELQDGGLPSRVRDVLTEKLNRIRGHFSDEGFIVNTGAKVVVTSEAGERVLVIVKSDRVDGELYFNFTGEGVITDLYDEGGDCTATQAQMYDDVADGLLPQ